MGPEMQNLLGALTELVHKLSQIAEEIRGLIEEERKDQRK